MTTSLATLEAVWTERLACPKCGAALRVDQPGAAKHLECTGCTARYPVRDGIPSFVDIAGSEQAAEIAQRDNEAASYEGLFLAWESFLEVPPLVRDLAPKKSDWILEVGAGTGRVVREYIRNVAGVVAIDFSFESLRHIRRSLELVPEAHDKLVPVHADATALPIRPGSFDRTVSAGMLQHLPGADARARAIAGMARSLRPGGRFVMQARHWSRAHAFYEHRKDSPFARRLASFLIGNASGGVDVPRSATYADGTVSLYNTPADELRDLAQRAGLHVDRVVGRIQTAKGMQRLGVLRPLAERVLERTPLSLIAAQEVVAVGTRTG
jgi:SAM-dependent methyltransferase